MTSRSDLISDSIGNGINKKWISEFILPLEKHKWKFSKFFATSEENRITMETCKENDTDKENDRRKEKVNKMNIYH